MALQLRRGTNQQRLGLTPVEGEMIYITDSVLVSISVTSINTTTETLSTTTPHNLNVDQQIKYIGNTLNGLTKNQVYFVKTAPTITSFTLSTTLGGGTVNITGTYSVPLQFAVSPCNFAGQPIGYTESALWAGDGVTVGGLAVGITNLDALNDVLITAPINEGQFLVYDGANWVNENEVSVDTRAETLSLTRRSDSAGENYENEVTLRLQDRVYDTNSYTTDEGGPAISYERSSGVEYSKTYVSGGAVGAYTVTLNNVTNLVVGQRVDGTGLTRENPGALITNISGNQITLDKAFTVQASGTYTINAPISFGHVALEWFGSTNDHRFRVATSTDAFTESPSNVYPGTNVLIESTRNYSKFNEGVLFVNAINDRVGVNNTSPGYSLDVTGTANVTSNLTVGGTANITSNLTVDSGTLFVNASNNRVGINTTTPGNALEIANGAVYAHGTDRSVFEYDSTEVGTNSIIFLRKNYTNVGNTGAYADNDGSAIAFQLKSDTQPTIQPALIDVQWDSTASPNKNTTIRLRTDSADTIPPSLSSVATFSSDIATMPGDLNVAGGSFIVDSTNDRIGVNTTPTYDITVYKAAAPALALINAERTFILTNNAADDLLSFNYGGANRLQFDGTHQWFNSGRLGIANASPTVELDVTGAAKISSNLTVDSGVLFVNASTNRVGINNVTPNFALDISGDAYMSGNLTVAGGNITTSTGTGNLFNTTATTVNIGNGATTEVNVGCPTGGSRVFIKAPTLDVSSVANITTSLRTPSITTLSGADLNITPNTGGELTLATNQSADPVTLTRITTSTNGAIRTLRTRVESTGTPAVGLGNLLTFETETTPGTYGVGGYLETVSTAATAGVLDTFKMNFGVMNTVGGTTTVVPRMSLTGNGDLQVDNNVQIDGNLQTPNTDTVTSGNISLATAITKFTTPAVNTCTLPNGNNGQFKTLVRTGASNSMTVTVTTAGWKFGASGTITFGDQGDSCFLQYVDGWGWTALGQGQGAQQPVFS